MVSSAFSQARTVFARLLGPCAIILVLGVICPRVSAQANRETLVATVEIDPTSFANDTCKETAHGPNLLSRPRRASEIFTEVSKVHPSPLANFRIWPEDLEPKERDRVLIYAPEGEKVDLFQLEELKRDIQGFVEPTVEVTVIGWMDNKNQHHAGLEFWDLIRAANGASHPVDLRNADFSGLRFNRHSLREMDFSGANFVGASLCGLDERIQPTFLKFDDADFTGANLSHSDFTGASFVRAKFIDTDLVGSIFVDADLAGALFEPSTLPSIDGFARARNIEKISFRTSPKALNEMRRELDEAGDGKQARAVSYALNETKDAQLLHSCRPPDETGKDWIVSGLSPMRRPDHMACTTYYFRKALFEKPNAYGMSRSRPLLLLTVVWAIGTLMYWGFLQTNRRSNVLIRLSNQAHTRNHDFRIQRHYWAYRNRKGRRSRTTRVILAIRDQVRLASAAAFYSLTSVTALSFREWDPSRWLSLLLDRKYEVIGRGWVKRLAGLQSLISLYLLVLLVLSFFELPFLQ